MDRDQRVVEVEKFGFASVEVSKKEEDFKAVLAALNLK